MGRKAPFFSIIVPTYNRPAQLGLCLTYLSRLEYEPDRFEVIVVDEQRTGHSAQYRCCAGEGAIPGLHG